MALSNDLKVLTWIANKGLKFLLQNLAFVRCGTSEYAQEFDNREYAKGDSIQIRRVNRRIGGEGATINLDGVIEKTETLTIEKQFNDGLVWTTKEQALFVTGQEGAEIYAERYIKPSILRLAHQVHGYLAGRAETDLYNYIGAAATPINTYAQVANIHARMERLSMPMGETKYLLVTPEDGAALKSALSNFFNPNLHKGIDEKYFLQRLADFEFEQTAGIKRHVSGAAGGLGGLTVKTDVTSGSSVVITGFGGVVADTFKKGDVITIAGTYIVSPGSYDTTSINPQFIVTADAGASDALGDVTVAISPEVIIDPTNPFRNLSAKLAAGAAVTCVASHNVNAAMIDGALSYAMPRMQKMWTPYCVDVADTQFGTGITLRLSKGADIVNDKNIMRWDLLVGAKFHPEYAVRVVT